MWRNNVNELELVRKGQNLIVKFEHFLLKRKAGLTCFFDLICICQTHSDAKKTTESSKINQFYFKNSILRFAISQVANK